MTAGGGSDQGRTAMARTVLVVDDEPNIVLSLEFLIEQAGFEARVARDGEAALAAIEASKPDLVLLDVMLPKRDGFDVCETIRANPDWNDVRIVMLTAKGRDSERKKGLALGADAYITKPFSTREAMEQIKRFLDDGAPEP
jgi:DNA-binding response OmpR family regulator